MFAPKSAKAATKSPDVPDRRHTSQRSAPTTKLTGQSSVLRSRLAQHTSRNPLAQQPKLRTSDVTATGPHNVRHLTVGHVNDPLEHEAHRIADRALRSGTTHPLLQLGLSRARMHIGPQSEATAASLGAAAYTVGDHIVFGAGQYRPDTWSGQRLIAHEAVHVAQQLRSGRPMVQRAPVQMPPLQITSTINPVEKAVPNLDRLKGVGVTPQTTTLAHDDATIEKNSPDPATPLPFTTSGWDGTTILQKLGQYDRIDGTDSDAHRCVQAVGMASHIPDGPSSVVDYINTLIAQGSLGKLTNREITAIQVLHHVVGRIETQRATYGDLSWAQEALHDLFYDDVSGTPTADIPSQISPAFDLSKNLEPMDVWCDTPQQVMAQATQLKPGEQLLVEEWGVTFNEAFDELPPKESDKIKEGQSTVIDVNGKLVRIRRIPQDKRPPHTAIDLNRDMQSGHQLLIMSDAASGTLRLYDPETSDTGVHFNGLAANGSNFNEFFQDHPEIGIYHYIEIIGKLKPGMTAKTPSIPAGTKPYMPDSI